MEWNGPPFYDTYNVAAQNSIITLRYGNFYAQTVHLGPGEIFGSFFSFFFFDFDFDFDFGSRLVDRKNS